MKTILAIGIGAGNPDHVTVEAVEALNRVDVVFNLDKGPEKHKLAALRREICRRHIRHASYRVVDATHPDRDRDPADYQAAVLDQHRDKARLLGSLIDREMRDGERGAILVWGDPSLYDSTIRILQALVDQGTRDLAFDVIPGITSVQALAARHKVPLNQLGRAFGVTTGRRLAEEWPDTLDSVVVMLDAHATFKRFAEEDIDIFWGAYVGTPDEILVAGRLRDVAADIERLRAEARAAHGWIMDTYILHRVHGGDGGA